MNVFQLAYRNILFHTYRSTLIALAAVLLAGFTLGATLVLRGASDSLHLAIDRLGADIVIVPQGTETKAESALLMGAPTRIWMPASTVAKVRAIPGVAAASPQLFLSSLENASCCSVSNMFTVAFDPATDFTVRPWLDQNLGSGANLKLGEVIGGQYIFLPAGMENIELYGYLLTLKGNMSATGSGLDQSVFMTFETAQDVARISRSLAVKPLEIPTDQISAVLVKLQPGVNQRQAAVDILQSIPGVTPIQSSELFQNYRAQMNAILNSVSLIMAITWVLAALMLGIVFSVVANERRREMGALRAIGASRGYIFSSLLAEAGLIALAGGLAGTLLTVAVVALFRHFIVVSLGIPFLFPALPELLAQAGLGLLVALACIGLAALFPALRISRQEAAAAMRE
jgi:putative ABC transport system permease protein